MEDRRFIQSVVLSGSWLYDEAAEKRVIIIEQNYDYWYQLGVVDGDVGEDEVPELNKEGKAYYYKFSPLLSDDPPWGVDSDTYLSLEDAKKGAEDKVGQKIQWKKG